MDKRYALQTTPLGLQIAEKYPPYNIFQTKKVDFITIKVLTAYRFKPLCKKIQIIA